MKELLEKLENNRFIYKVRMDLEFDVKDYQELLKILLKLQYEIEQYPNLQFY